MKRLSFRLNGIDLRFFHSPKEPVKFLLNPAGTPSKSLLEWARLVEIQANGHNPDDHHGNKYTGTNPAGMLRYHSHRRTRTVLGTKLEIVQRGGGLEVTSHLQCLGKLPAFRSWTTVHNRESASLLLEYVSTFALSGISCGGRSSAWDRKMRLHLPDNAWCGESQWRSGSLPDFGLFKTTSDFHQAGFSTKRISIGSQGTWSTAEYLPMGVLENVETEQTLFWQIEHNGSWHWEISDRADELFLHLSGPTYRESLWSKRLARGESFTSAHATVGLLTGGLQDALRVLTQVRRLIRRPHPDMERMPVIFNDYMNCLNADPTTERLLPVIERAAKLGCEYFVIDAGWYAERKETWWTSVGLWQPSRSRFPGGLKRVIDTIRARGMVPGLWLEIEVMGIDCPLAKKWPKACFFQRDGVPVIDHGRYQLDFRHPIVRAHADETIDRLVREFGVGYIKMDYNINAGPGTDEKASAPGDGLLGHNRAYLDWLDAVFDRHPTLVIENCASGGMRLEYGMLSHHSIQSTSDQTDYRVNAVIAAASASAVTPEQAAVWSYPLAKSSDEEVIMNMVNGLLLRFHQSGRVHEISAKRCALITEALDLYKGIRGDLGTGLPFWPLGLPSLRDGWTAFGLRCGGSSYLAVWRFDGAAKTMELPLEYPGKIKTATCLYPQQPATTFALDAGRQLLRVTLPRKWSARLFELKGAGGK